MPANKVTRNVDSGQIALGAPTFRDELLTFAGDDDIAAGTILARSTVTGNLVLYAIAGANGANIPIAVLTYPVSRAAAGDEPVRVLIEGRVNASRLVVDADGDGSNLTNAILDELKASSIVAVPVNQLAQLDNQT